MTNGLSSRFTILFFLSSKVVAGIENNYSTKEIIENAGCPFTSESQMLEKNVCLMPQYASNELPMNSNGPSNVSLYLLNVYVLEVDEVKNAVTVELLQYLEWTEPRIRANFSSAINQKKIKLSTKSTNRIWHPELDVYTKDMKEWKSLFDPMLYQDIYLSKPKNKSNIKLSVLKSWKATIFCQFDFSLFPFDTQHCAFLQFAGTPDLHIISLCRPIATKEKYKLNKFKVSFSPVGAMCSHANSSDRGLKLSFVDTGFNITLKRKISVYLYTYYLPCLAIVVVSQVSFIVPLSSIPGRIGLVVTQFLTLTNIFIHQMSGVHSEGSLNSLSIHLLVSLFFVIATMIELAIVLTIKRYGEFEPETESDVTTNMVELTVSNQISKKDKMTSNSYSRRYSITDTIDFIALCIFFVAYLIFNCIYIAIYV